MAQHFNEILKAVPIVIGKLASSYLHKLPQI